MSRADALIVVALAIERQAVREHMIDVEVTRTGSSTVDLGTFETIRGPLIVAVLETGPGNIDAAIATGSAIEDLEPSSLLMVGIAGGIKDVAIGDVVASSKTYWVESGKVANDREAAGKTELLHRPDFAPVSKRLVHTARAVVADARWPTGAHGKGGTRVGGGIPAALVAPIAIGEKVWGASAAEFVRGVRRSFSDAVAVAMEDVGVLRSAYDRGCDAIAVRAISDLLDNKSQTDEGDGQSLAAANAAAFAFELLALDLRLAMATGPDPRDLTALTGLASELFPNGPMDRMLWQRAGGDPSRLQTYGTGRSQWWAALRQLSLGGGGTGVTAESLLVAMLEEYPNHEPLIVAARRV